MISSVRRPPVCATGLTVALASSVTVRDSVSGLHRRQASAVRLNRKNQGVSPWGLRRARRGYLRLIVAVLRTFQWLSG